MTTYPVGLARDLPNGRVMRAGVDGVDMVVWRDSRGTLAAWGNRCPHRGMRLSHGFVRGDRLACLYHGWQYDASGQCRYIPAHPDLNPPESIRTVSYHAAETGGVIWVSLSEGPEPPEMPADFEPLRTVFVTASEAAVTAAASRTGLEGPPAKETAPGVFDIARRRIILFCNPAGPERTEVHSLIEPGASSEEKRLASRWCEAVRRTAEASERAAA
ncbi:MAG: Rieske (2Fe-2S) protein [Pseudomonadota bacterium]